ncbi:hypothetical protein M9H77_20914 [Catharanthus roseus]|uniref:Uncharacterized protein n=1 Tax=Catharanthus roseus TaxID=4058 RepID=A0ACC0AQ23_CATRO|nr:hypothetical protein M9H77_20914 [Catharanthus roseus]
MKTYHHRGKNRRQKDEDTEKTRRRRAAAVVYGPRRGLVGNGHNFALGRPIEAILVGISIEEESDTNSKEGRVKKEKHKKRRRNGYTKTEVRRGVKKGESQRAARVGSARPGLASLTQSKTEHLLFS